MAPSDSCATRGCPTRAVAAVRRQAYRLRPGIEFKTYLFRLSHVNAGERKCWQFSAHLVRRRNFANKVDYFSQDIASKFFPLFQCADRNFICGAGKYTPDLVLSTQRGETRFGMKLVFADLRFSGKANYSGHSKTVSVARGRTIHSPCPTRLSSNSA